MRVIFISTWNHEDAGGALFEGCHRHISGVAFDTLLEAAQHQLDFKKHSKPEDVAAGIILVTADDLER